MRDNNLLNESYYGAYGHNRNFHNDATPGDDYRDRTSREYASDRHRFNEEAEHRRNLENSRQPNQNYYSNRNAAPRNFQEHRPYDPAYYRYLNRNMGTHQRAAYSRGMYGIPGPDPDTGRYMYYGNTESYPHENHDRGLASQFTDEVRSWFGDREAAQRRRMDYRDSLGEAWHSDDRDQRNNYNNRDRFRDNERDGNWIRNHNINNGWW